MTSVPVHDGTPATTLAEVYHGQYPSLVRLAAMLLDDPHAAEDVAQDAYVRVAARHHRLRDPQKALAYLRQTVVNLARNTLRRRILARRHAEVRVTDVSSAEDDALGRFRRQAVVRALQALPRRQREVLVLRHYLDCTVAETADLLGLGDGTVKAYASRGARQLRTLIERMEAEQ